MQESEVMVSYRGVGKPIFPRDDPGDETVENEVISSSSPTQTTTPSQIFDTKKNSCFYQPLFAEVFGADEMPFYLANFHPDH